MSSDEPFKGKRLFILRHAQAASHASDGDKSRVLSDQGKEDALALGRMMKEQYYHPDFVLCSSAVRTKQTLEGVNTHLETSQVKYADILYSGSTGDYLYEIQQMKDDVQNLMIVAHNPCIYELVLVLAAQGSDAVMQRLSMGYHPASLSVVHCQSERWAELQPAENTLIQLVNPTDYNV